MPRRPAAGDPLDLVTELLLEDGVPLHRAIGFEVRLRERWGGRRCYVRMTPERRQGRAADAGGASLPADPL